MTTQIWIHAIKQKSLLYIKQSKKGNIEAIKLLLESGTDIHAKHSRGFTTLHTAVYHRQLNALKLLLSVDRSLLNIPDATGNTPINIAAAKGHKTVLAYLFKEGADITIRNKNGNTPFHSAAQGKRLSTLNILIKLDRSMIDDVNRDGNTPLHIAAHRGYNEIIELLLSKGATYKKKNFKGKLPTQMSSKSTLKVFRKFREFNDIVHRCQSSMAPLLATKRYEDNNTALHIVASFYGYPELIARLVSGGANINAHNSFNQTPLHLAVMSENIDNVRALVLLGGKVDDPDQERGQTALHIASMNHDLEILKVLTRRSSVDVNVVDKDGKTPLSYAIVHQSRTAVQHLIRHGADVGLKDRHGQTALHLSVLTNNAEITEDLLSAVNTNTVNEKNIDGQTPLIFAVDRKSLTFDDNTVKLIDILIQKGADPHQKNNCGASAYSLAAEKGFDITERICAA